MKQKFILNLIKSSKNMLQYLRFHEAFGHFRENKIEWVNLFQFGFWADVVDVSHAIIQKLVIEVPINKKYV